MCACVWVHAVFCGGVNAVCVWGGVCVWCVCVPCGFWVVCARRDLCVDLCVGGGWGCAHRVCVFYVGV